MASFGTRGSWRDLRRAILLVPCGRFLLHLCQPIPSAQVAELGCGTGRLTLARAAAGHQATGVDPARASLDAAQAKPDAVDQIYGGWDGGPADSTDGELLVLAHRSAATGH